MLNKLRVHGFRTLFQTQVAFSPFTILIGKNGVGKTTLLDVIEIIGKFARGGAQRAFGPPPWSLGWQRTKGIGHIETVDFELLVTTKTGSQYCYTLRLNERDNQVHVKEERLMRTSDNTAIASLQWGQPPRSGTILQPDSVGVNSAEIEAVASIFKSFDSYELNPALIERGNDPKQIYVTRDGFGVAGYLAHLKDNDHRRFQQLEACLKRFRPETESIEVWSPADETYWGLRDKGQKYPFTAVHLSWGERQLVGLLCVLFSTPGDATIALEEIDRGFHPSRYNQVIEVLTEAVHKGLVDGQKIQIIVTTHSPSFVNKLDDRIGDIQLVTRAPSGGTVARSLPEVLREKLGSDKLEQPVGEVWEMGLLEEVFHEAML